MGNKRLIQSNELQLLILMRILVIILCLASASSFANISQNHPGSRHLQAAQESHDQESKFDRNANAQQYFSKSGEKDEDLIKQRQNYGLRTKGTIAVVVVLLIFLIAKKCCQSSSKLQSVQQKYTKHKSNQKSQDEQESDGNQECPIILGFDIQTIKSKYLVDNYGLRASRLSQTACQPIVSIE